MIRRIRLTACMFAVLLAAAATAGADTIRQRWGGSGEALSFPGMMKAVPGPGGVRLVFDLSAIPAGSTVHHARLVADRRDGQPREPILIHVVDALPEGAPPTHGAALELEPPYYRSFDATAAVRAWVGRPAANLGLLLTRPEGLDAGAAYLEVMYDARDAKVPPQVTHLRAIHRGGQTMLIFQELPEFRPAAGEIVYIRKWAGAETQTAASPGKDVVGNPTQPAVLLETLRRLQGLKVRTTPGRGQNEPDFERVRRVPEVRYRVYRSDRPITAANIHRAEQVGEAAALCGYDQRMVIIFFSGEYYQKHERPDNVIPTYCVDDRTALAPGEAFYCHTPAAAGRRYYAVTACRDGTENLATVTAANSLAEPVVETAAAPQPIRYFDTPSTVRARRDASMEHWFLFWMAPPLANLPQQTPRRICLAVPDDFKAPGPLLIDTRGSIGREGQQADTPGAINLRIEAEGGVAYNSGRDTLRSFSETRLDYYPERHVFHVIDWARAHWKIDPARISGTKGMDLHLAIRHPEVFRVFWPDRPEFYQNDFDSKWNPRGWNLGRALGPPDLVKTPDGSPAWDIYNIAWYLDRNPGKDIPFMGCLFSQPKDGNHGAEYGWQDDPKGWAALRDHRQPYVAQWGGAGIDGQVRSGLYALRWDRSVPAFSNCSLDNNPGTGDCDAGDPWGQINGYLFWDYDSIVDQPDRWEMTVLLVRPDRNGAGGSPEPTCTVDITPRFRRAFLPKAGERIAWSSTVEGRSAAAESGVVTTDPWGLVTLRHVTISQDRNRIVLLRGK